MSDVAASRREFRILGPLEVLADDRPVAVVGPRRRGLLARLLIDANHVVSVDRLVEDLWAGQPGEAARNAVQAGVSRLRSDLAPLARGETGTVLVTRAPGYVLRTEPGEVDAARFHRECEIALDDRDAGDIESAARRLRDAMTLWRGSALAEFDGETWALTAIEALREARMAAMEEWFELELQLGRHAGAVTELERVVAAEPMRERLHGLLMLALYRNGRQADALAVYVRLRRWLGSELGLEPAPELRRLETDILQQRPELDWRSPTEEGHGGPDLIRPLLALPAHLRLVADSRSFVGRKTEFEQLRAAWTGCTAESTRLLLVKGEPGIGKTRLIAEFAGEVHSNGGLVLYGRCREDSGVPYQPVVEALRPWVTSRPPAELAPRIQAVPVLGRLFPELDRHAAAVPLGRTADMERFVLFEAVRDLLADICSAAPVVLVLDDLHWATTPTLLLLRHLVTSAPDLTLLVIGAYRDTEAGPGHPLDDWLADMAGEEALGRVPLGGLSEAEASGLVSAVGGDAATRDVVRLVHTGTGGNPFFIGEIIRHLHETAASPEVGSDAASTLRGLGIPEGVRAVVARRLGRLSPPARAAVAAVALAGDRVPMSLLRRLPGVMPGTRMGLASAIDEAVAARLLVQAGPGRYAVAHALVGHVASGELGDAQRGELHAEIARAVEELPAASEGALAAQARHFAEALLLGADVDPDRAVHHIELAAREALDQLAYEEAIRHLQRGLQIVDDHDIEDVEARPRLLLDLASAQLWLSDEPACMDTCLALADAARPIGSSRLLAHAALLRSSMAVFQPDPATEAMCNEALATLDEGDIGLRAQVMAGLAEYHCRELSEGTSAGPRAAEALELARRSEDPVAMGRALSARAMTLLGTPDMRELRTVADDMLALGHGMSGGTFGYGYRAVARLAFGEFEGYVEDITEVEKWGRARRAHFTMGVAAQYFSVAAYVEGRFDDAERYADELVEWSPTPTHMGARMLILFFVRREQGRCQEAASDLADVLALYPEQAGAKALLVYSHLESGRLELACEVLDRFAPNGFAGLDGDILRPCALVALAETAAVLRDTARGAQLYDQLLPFAGQIIVSWDAAGCLGAVDRHLGMLAMTLGRYDDADRWFRAAVALEDAMGARPFAARTRYWFGRMLLERDRPNDHARARELLEASAATARALGMGTMACVA